MAEQNRNPNPAGADRIPPPVELPPEILRSMQVTWEGACDPETPSGRTIKGEIADALASIAASGGPRRTCYGGADATFAGMDTLRPEQIPTAGVEATLASITADLPRDRMETTWGAEPAPEDPEAGLKIRPRVLRHAGDPEAATAEYELLKKLGEGGMGVVFDARQTSVDRWVAVKMLNPRAARNERHESDLRRKFLAEAVVTGDLDHPNIVPIYDVGRDDQGVLFYSMKRVQGTPWLEVIRQRTVHENLEILMRVADAVAFAHARGVVHRDLKPENVMLGEFGEVLVMDWGLAFPTEAFHKGRTAHRAGGMGGTPAYMAPEMATGPLQRIGPWSDVYLLGGILYEIVTGSPPHRGENAMQCLMAAARNEIVPTDQVSELVEIALRAMSFRSEDRYGSVQEFQAAVRDYLSHSESVLLSARADEDLQRARKTDQYNDYQKAVFNYLEAHELWSGNTKALAGLAAAQLAYARSAFCKGDYDLAAGMLDPGHPEHAVLLRDVQEAIKERDARLYRLQTARHVRAGLAAALFFVIAGAAVWVNKERLEAESAWAETRVQKDLADERRKEAESARADAVAQRDVARQQQSEAEAARAEALAQEMVAIQNSRRAEYEAYIAQIGLAAAKIDENAFDSARDLLHAVPLGQRNWEWGRLMHLCSQHQESFHVGARVTSLAVSPDGTRFIVGGWDGLAQICDAGSGEVIHRLPYAATVRVEAVAFSPDGRKVATGGSDGLARIWDAKTSALLHTLRGHEQQVVSLAFSYSGGGQWLLTASHDMSAGLWDVASGEPIRRFVGHWDRVWAVAFCPNRRMGADGAAIFENETRLMTADQRGEAVVWTDATGQWRDDSVVRQSTPFRGHSGPIYCASFSPDGGYAATGGYDRQVLVWDPEAISADRFENVKAGRSVAGRPEIYRALEGHDGPVRSVSFLDSHDGGRDLLLLSGSQDNTLRVWDVNAAANLTTFRGHDSLVLSCSFMPDGRSILSGSYDEQVKKWSIDGYEEIRVLQGRTFAGHADAVLAAAFSPDGRQIVTASQDRTAKIWEAGRAGSPQVTFREGHEFLASTARLLHRRGLLVTAAADNTVRIWDRTTGTQVLQLDGTGRNAALAVSGDERWLLTGSGQGAAKLWDLEQLFAVPSDNRDVQRRLPSPEPVAVLAGHRRDISAVAVSHDGTRLLTCDVGGHSRVWQWDAATERAREIVTLQAHVRLPKAHAGRIVAAAFLPDGRYALTASHDHTVACWDLETGQEVDARRLAHPDAVLALSVSSDGRLALTSCQDGLVRLWDVADAKMVWSSEPQPGAPHAVDLSSDGRWALAADAATGVLVAWDVQEDREVFRRTGVGTVWSAILTGDRRPSDEATAFDYLVVGGDGATLFDATGRPRMKFRPQDEVASAGFSPDGRYIVTGNWDHSARVWEVATGRAVLKLQGHAGPLTSTEFADATQVLTASEDGTVRYWEIDWDAKTARTVWTFHGSGKSGQQRHIIFDAVLSRDGRLAAVASEDGAVQILDAATGRPVGPPLRGHRGPVLCAAFSNDGRWIVTGSDDETARLWNVETRQTVLTFKGHTSGVLSVAFSPDGTRVLTGSRDNTAKLWDTRVPDGSDVASEILTLKRHEREVTSVAFTPDGRSALTAGKDGTAILWLTVDERLWRPAPEFARR